jgi:EmrB/QacA subfamily drug resistance transporter
MPSDRPSSISFGQYCIALTVTSVTLMELLDTTILNTALPAIAVSFNTTIVNLRVAITAYLATLAIFIPISGWVADRIGPKRTLLCATTLFTVSSMMCGLSTSLGPFVLFRILQGIGGAMMTPVSRIILVRLFRDEGEDAFQKVAALVAIPLTFGPVLGPVLGGWLTTHLSWHWIFFVNLPIGLASFCAISLLIRNEPVTQKFSFDLSGFLMAGSGLAALSLALETVENRNVPLYLTLFAGLAGLLLLVGAVRHSLNRQGAIFDLTLFRIPSFRIGALLTIFGTATSVGIQVLLPTMFQLGFGMNAFQSGLMTVSIVLGVVAMKPMIAPLFRHLGHRRVLTLYPLLLGITIIGFRSFNPHTPHLLIFLLLFLYGLWLSVHGNVINVIPYLKVPHERISLASSLQSTLFQFSLSLGVTFGALVLHGLLAAQGLTLMPGTPPEKILSAFHDSFTILGLLTCCVAILGWRYRTVDATPNTRHGENS